MPKVREFQTEQNDRIKTQATFISDKYGPCLTVEKAAAAIGIGKSTLRRAITKKEVNYSRTSKDPKRRGTIIFTALDIAKYIESMRE